MNRQREPRSLNAPLLGEGLARIYRGILAVVGALRRAKEPPSAAGDSGVASPVPPEQFVGRCGICPAPVDPERTSTHMISADDAEYPREYRTLGNGTRRFSNVGLVHTSERRHTVIAAQSLEALTGLQKSEMERKRDAFMDHLKNKYPQHALALRGQQERMRDQTPPRGTEATAPSPSAAERNPAL
ncbi:SRC kinase signaling inhibitor 1 isoform X1 [Athene cunicularia]|uniref:SRC kinase signaling inhibitor 1 isoform X1 n=1 Tax=Athene cunicularia TaxID=194338 RepID=UPI000EF6DE4C|nr:SRC kinase signaling inhibitor 1 isoform X1 [Athene cunicularia]